MDRFWNKVEKNFRTGCWDWTGAKIPDGYGSIWYEGRAHLAHRVSWWLAGREIPEGKQLDHLCRNRRCVNPDHLEPVTNRENSHRGLSGAKNRAKTQCKNGHEFTPENTGEFGGKRYCRSCRRQWSRDYRAAQKSATNRG